MAAEPISVLVVGHDSLVRNGLRAALEREPGLSVVASCATGEQALETFDATPVDVAVIDQRLSDMGAHALCREIAERRLTASVVVLSAELDEGVAEAAFLAGARGYVVKDVDSSELMHAIRAVAAGQTYLDPKVTGRTIAWALRRQG